MYCTAGDKDGDGTDPNEVDDGNGENEHEVKRCADEVKLDEEGYVERPVATGFGKSRGSCDGKELDIVSSPSIF